MIPVALIVAVALVPAVALIVGAWTDPAVLTVRTLNVGVVSLVDLRRAWEEALALLNATEFGVTADLTHVAVVLLLSTELPDLLHGNVLELTWSSLDLGIDLTHAAVVLLLSTELPDLFHGNVLELTWSSLDLGILLALVQGPHLAELFEPVQKFGTLGLCTANTVDHEAFFSGLVEDAGGAGEVDGGDLLF